MIRYLRHLVFQCKESGCMSQVIRVGMADLNVCKSPDTIITLGLGSCIGLTFYEDRKSVV